MKIKALALVMCAVATPALASFEPVSYLPNLGTDDDYVSSDWTLTCDNIGTCRADGYHDDGDFEWQDEMVSVLISRKMGGVAEGFVNFSLDDENLWKTFTNTVKQGKAPTLYVAGKSYGQIQMDKADTIGVGKLSANQLSTIIAQAKTPTFKVEFRLDTHRWVLSDKGFKEVLTKMDEVQGYDGTPLAFVKKGSKKAPTKTDAYPILADKPILSDKETFIPIDSQDGQKLITLLKNHAKQLDAEEYADMSECMILNEPDELFDGQKSFTALQVAKDKKLIIGSCWRGAYNFGSGAWLTDNNYTKVHQAISTSINDWAGNRLFANHKGRGLGDCWSNTVWTWDGQRFVRTYEGDTGLCRGFAGGAWTLPSNVVDVASDKGDLDRLTP